MSNENQQGTAGENLRKVVDRASSSKPTRSEAETNKKGMRNSRGDFIKYNDTTLPSQF